MNNILILAVDKQPDSVHVLINSKHYHYLASEFIIRKFEEQLYKSKAAGGSGFSALNWLKERSKLCQ